MQSPSSSPEGPLSPSLAALSRKASVFSTSSSSDGDSDSTPTCATPTRKFEGPLSSRIRSPLLPPAARKTRPPSFFTKGLDQSLISPTRIGASRGKTRIDSDVRMADFTVGATLGHGSYSTVSLVTHNGTGRKYAVKAIDKNHLEKNRKANTVYVERAALECLGSGHPGIVGLHYFFEDTWSFYWVSRGELQSLITKLGSLSTQCICYYAAQIIDAVRYMHEHGVIHRDLKPANILLDDNFRLRIVDFGTAIVLDSDLEPEKFAGTAQFMAPEQFTENVSSRSSDIWSIGCIIFHMIAGRYPFVGSSPYLVMEKVKKIEYVFPKDFDPSGRDVVQSILVRDPDERLGGGEGQEKDMKALMGHKFFSLISWPDIWTGPVPSIEPGLVHKDLFAHDATTPPSSARSFVVDIDGIPWATDDASVTTVCDGGQNETDPPLEAMHANLNSQVTPESSPESGNPAKNGIIHSLKTLSLDTVLKKRSPTKSLHIHLSPI